MGAVVRQKPDTTVMVRLKPDTTVMVRLKPDTTGELSVFRRTGQMRS